MKPIEWTLSHSGNRIGHNFYYCSAAFTNQIDCIYHCWTRINETKCSNCNRDIPKSLIIVAKIISNEKI